MEKQIRIINANTIKYNQQENLITAYGGTDTSKGALNLPTFTQGEQTSTMDTVFYNLKTQRGITRTTYYQEGELFVNAQTAILIRRILIYVLKK